ncbi:NADH-dependent [FeFe] hydrogenase, group A6 [Endomicrobium proavitum]|uniref:[FeFe]-hydrogenase, NADP-reducing hydrogenase large subunit n=1 Tax=Endomicrobium proavitum TaxID=1408281 RepID=A0A0G3WII0_9BACT|nr:NADH-dependent [FeFe] hydrogenase, group A6 [Endomicrobium proavitum]AKL98113.1 [FeFe]-hydrogenase, NADP-reducing hydrogenase large subunit [Endomicrobium proavitum]
MIKVYINDRPYDVVDGITIMQAATTAGYKIPSLCYHPRLSTYGGCRVCIVEVEGIKNFVASCSYPVKEGMKIHTNTEAIRKARKEIVELILDNHPQDCNVCMRNGMCELQNLARTVGVETRDFEGARKKYDKDNASPCVTNNQEKCILCGRCVRTCAEIQNIHAIDFVNRGINTKISPAFNASFKDSVCSNCGQCINVCPTATLMEHNYIKEAFAALNDKSKIKIAQIAPSVRAAIGEYFGIKPGQNWEKETAAALRKLGFDYVFDTQFAADLTIMEEASEFLDRLKNGGVLPMITSCSSAWMKAMEQFYSDLIPNVSSCRSPMSMLSSITKTYFAKQINADPKNIVNIAFMCCVAKKYEAARPELEIDGMRTTDYSLTTRELGWMLKSAGIDLPTLKGEEFDSPLGQSSGAATIFGATGGVMEAALRTAYEFATGKTLENIDIKEARGIAGIKEGKIDVGGTEIRFAVASGLGNASKVLNEVRKDKNKYHFIEIMACPGGCIGGGGQPYAGLGSQPFDIGLLKLRAQALYNCDVAKVIRKSHENPDIQKLYKDFLGKPLGEKAHKLLHTHYKQHFPVGILPNKNKS